MREPVTIPFERPLQSLDAELRLQKGVETANLGAKLGNTMIHVTHDQIETMTLADRIVVPGGGTIALIGKPLDAITCIREVGAVS